MFLEIEKTGLLYLINILLSKLFVSKSFIERKDPGTLVPFYTCSQPAVIVSLCLTEEIPESNQSTLLNSALYPHSTILVSEYTVFPLFGPQRAY